MPWSGRSNRIRTDSFATIWFTVKCRADVPQEIDDARARRATRRCRRRGRRARTGVEKSRKRSSCGRIPTRLAVEFVAGDERALLGPLAGIADEARPAPGDGDRPVAGELEPAQGAQLQEIAHLQAVDRRVEADVDALAPGVEPREQCRVAHLVDEPAEREVLRAARHRFSLPQAPGRPADRAPPAGMRDRRAVGVETADDPA